MKLSRRQWSSARRAASYRCRNMETSLLELLLCLAVCLSALRAKEIQRLRECQDAVFHVSPSQSLTIPTYQNIRIACDVTKGHNMVVCHPDFLVYLQRSDFHLNHSFREIPEGTPLESRMEGRAESAATNPLAHAASRKQPLALTFPHSGRRMLLNNAATDTQAAGEKQLAVSYDAHVVA